MADESVPKTGAGASNHFNQVILNGGIPERFSCLFLHKKVLLNLVYKDCYSYLSIINKPIALPLPKLTEVKKHG